MAARLGDVLYWAAAMVAVLAIGRGFYAWTYGGGPDSDLGWFLIIFGVLCWLLGKAIRYVLAGR
jgi:hypothetical protein